MEISSVFFSEFHYIHGPVIYMDTRHQDGEIISDKEFNLLSDYIIPKPTMCGKLFTMRLKNYTLMGMPIEILNEKYQRKAIEFNLGFFLNRKK